jgi:hypothetical protein
LWITGTSKSAERFEQWPTRRGEAMPDKHTEHEPPGGDLALEALNEIQRGRLYLVARLGRLMPPGKVGAGRGNKNSKADLPFSKPTLSAYRKVGKHEPPGGELALKLEPILAAQAKERQREGGLTFRRILRKVQSTPAMNWPNSPDSAMTRSASNWTATKSTSAWPNSRQRFAAWTAALTFRFERGRELW